MADMTDYFEAATLDFWFNDANFAKPTLYVSWYTSGTGLETGSNTNEVTELGRENVTFGNSTGGTRSVSNTNQIDIDTTGSGVNATVTHWALHDSATLGAGNMICYRQIDSPAGGFTIVDPQPLRINIGAMVWNFPDTNGVLTNGLVDAWLSHVFGSTTATRPTGWNISLHTADPGHTGANEFVTASYARQSVNWTPAAINGAEHEVDNTADITFTDLNDSPIAYWGVWDQSTTFLARFDQSDEPVTAGSNATAGANTLKLRVG